MEKLPESLSKKLERAAFLARDIDWQNRDDVDELADERSALTSELSAVFGMVIRQLADAEILSVTVAGSGSSDVANARITGVHSDEEFGIILECER
jgi:hypothetical protein